MSKTQIDGELSREIVDALTKVATDMQDSNMVLSTELLVLRAKLVSAMDGYGDTRFYPGDQVTLAINNESLPPLEQSTHASVVGVAQRTRGEMKENYVIIQVAAPFQDMYGWVWNGELFTFVVPADNLNLITARKHVSQAELNNMSGARYGSSPELPDTAKYSAKTRFSWRQLQRYSLRSALESWKGR